MKKIVGILYNSYFDETSFESGCGGSETWVIQISKEFVKHNYHVIIFSQYDDWYIFDSGVEYVPLNFFESRIQYQHFDFFIFVRSLDKYYDTFIEHNDCKNIYVQSHDQFIWKDGIYNEKFIYDDFDNRFELVKKFIALTNFHKWELMTYNNIPENKIEVIGNGLNSEIFDNINKENIEKDKSILWTSAFGRGGDILVNDILPIIKPVIPSFKVYICGYEDNVPDEVKNNPDVEFLGTLSKEDYYKEFKKQCCWFLPCVVVEDFGICAAEAVMCDCDIISPFKHGMKDVCWPFESLKLNSEFKVIETDDYHYGNYKLNMTREEYSKACHEAAYKIIESINNYKDENRKKIRRICKEFIMKEYTWNNIVNKWTNMFELTSKISF